MNDDKLLSDIIVGLKHLSLAFQQNGLQPPVAVGVDRKTYDRLKMLRPMHMVYDPAVKTMKVEIAGVEFAPIVPT